MVLRLINSRLYIISLIVYIYWPVNGYGLQLGLGFVCRLGHMLDGPGWPPDIGLGGLHTLCVLGERSTNIGRNQFLRLCRKAGMQGSLENCSIGINCHTAPLSLAIFRRAGPLIATCNPHLRQQPPGNTGTFSHGFGKSSSGSGEFESLIFCKEFTYDRSISRHTPVVNAVHHYKMSLILRIYKVSVTS